MQTQTRGDKKGGPDRMGQGQQGTGQAAPLSEVDAIRGITEALNRIAGALEANAAATELLARATAGELDQDHEDVPLRDLAGRPIG
jgi:hypothetical protein